MTMTRPSLPDAVQGFEARCLDVALELARSAGAQLFRHLEERGPEEPTLEFKGRRELVTDADKESERSIVAGVREAFPEHAILAEEGVATPVGEASHEGRHCWVIDPLDGTTNFVHGHPFYCVSIGLLEDGAPKLGVVHAPAIGGDGGTFFYGVTGVGAWRDGRPIHVSRTESLRDAVVATGFAYRRNEPGVNTNLDNFGRMLMEARGIRRCGSAALDLALTAAGVFDVFWELYLGPWDVVAGAALVLAAGGELTDLGSGGDVVHGGEMLATNGRLTEAAAALLTGLPKS